MITTYHSLVRSRRFQANMPHTHSDLREVERIHPHTVHTPSLDFRFPWSDDPQHRDRNQPDPRQLDVFLSHKLHTWWHPCSSRDFPRYMDHTRLTDLNAQIFPRDTTDIQHCPRSDRSGLGCSQNTQSVQSDFGNVQYGKQDRHGNPCLQDHQPHPSIVPYHMVRTRRRPQWYHPHRST